MVESIENKKNYFVPAGHNYWLGDRQKDDTAQDTRFTKKEDAVIPFSERAIPRLYAVSVEI